MAIKLPTTLEGKQQLQKEVEKLKKEEAKKVKPLKGNLSLKDIENLKKEAEKRQKLMFLKVNKITDKIIKDELSLSKKEIADDKKQALKLQKEEQIDEVKDKKETLVDKAKQRIIDKKNAALDRVLNPTLDDITKTVLLIG